MNLISADEVKKTYKEMWSFMMPPLCKDKVYELESPVKIKYIIDKCERYKTLKFVEQKVDCDDFARSLWDEFCEIWGKTPEYKLPCPVGRASGMRFRGENENHTVTTFLTADGIYFFDPTQQFIPVERWWKADKKNDLIFLVEM